MKTIRLLSASLFLCVVLLISVSFDETEQYTPIFMDATELPHSVKFISEKRELVNPGKIYYREPYLFINEKYKGVHIYDNSNPASPQYMGFVTAPGCLDVAVKGNILYLDNAIDLVAFDLNSKQVTQRIQSVFPEPGHPHNSRYTYSNKPEGLILVEWKKNY